MREIKKHIRGNAIGMGLLSAIIQATIWVLFYLGHLTMIQSLILSGSMAVLSIIIWVVLRRQIIIEEIDTETPFSRLRELKQRFPWFSKRVEKVSATKNVKLSELDCKELCSAIDCFSKEGRQFAREELKASLLQLFPLSYYRDIFVPTSLSGQDQIEFDCDFLIYLDTISTTPIAEEFKPWENNYLQGCLYGQILAIESSTGVQDEAWKILVKLWSYLDEASCSTEKKEAIEKFQSDLFIATKKRNDKTINKK